MPTIHRFEEIQAWQTARELTRQLSRFIAYLRAHPAQGAREACMDYEIDT